MLIRISEDARLLGILVGVGGGGELGALPIATRSADDLPAVFVSIAARDTYYTNNPGDIAAGTDLANREAAVAIGPTDGVPTGLTGAFIRNEANDDWVPIATNFRGDPGATGPAGPAGPGGNPLADEDITADLTISATTPNNIATYRNKNVVNTRSTAGAVTVTMDTIASFLTATPGDEFVIQFVNESGVSTLIIAPAVNEQFGQTLGNISLSRGQALRIKLPNSGTVWSVLSETTNASSGVNPGGPIMIPSGGVVLQGDWDASTGTFPAGASQGHLYIISVAGEVDSMQFNQGDLLLAIVNNPSTTVFANNWTVVDGGDNVHSWAGMQGVITDTEIRAVMDRLGYDRNVGLQWDFATTVDSSDPGTGNVAFNNAAKENATEVTFNIASGRGEARVDEVLENVRVGDRALFQSRETPENYVLFHVEQAPELTNNKVDIPVSSERAGGAEFSAGDTLNVAFFFTSVGAEPLPSLHDFTIDIAPRVDLNTDLNVQHTVGFSVTNHSHLTALELVVTTGTNQTLTLPTSDGLQSQTVTLAGIDTSSAGTVTFQLSGTYPGGTVTSNLVSIEVRDLLATEQTYYGVLNNENAFATVDVSTLTAVDVTNSGTVFTITESAPNTHVLGILSRDNRDPVSILNTVSNQPALDTFNATPNVRQIDGFAYNLLASANNSGFQATFNYRVTTE